MTVTRVEGISYLPITGTVSFDSSALLGFSVVCRFIWVFSTRLLINEESVQVRISTQLLPSIGIRRLAAVRSRPANRGTKSSR